MRRPRRKGWHTKRAEARGCFVLLVLGVVGVIILIKLTGFDVWIDSW